MSLKVMDVNAFLEALVDSATPEYAKVQKDWFLKVTKKVTEYAVALTTEAGIDPSKVPANPDGSAAKVYNELCEMLLYGLPSRAADTKQISDLEEEIDTMGAALLHFMTKYPVADNHLIISHEELASARIFEAFSVTACPQHGIHVHAINEGATPSGHAH